MVVKTQEIERLAQAEDLYARMARVIEESELEINKITDLIDEAVGLIISNNPALLVLTQRDLSPDHYGAHRVNLCIWAMEIGQALGYDKTKLSALGLVALLHDTGWEELLPSVHENDIDEYARIIGLVDIFQTMFYPGSLENKKSLQEVSEGLMPKMAEEFDKNILKILVTRIDRCKNY